MAPAFAPGMPCPCREATGPGDRQKSRPDLRPQDSRSPEGCGSGEGRTNAVRNSRSIHALVCQEIRSNSRCIHPSRTGLYPRTRRTKGSMKIDRITLREIRMPLVTPFETSFGRVTDRRMLLVEADADGVAGWGESVAGEGPFYAPETVETAWHILRDFIWPLLKGGEFSSATEIWEMLAPIRGHHMAKGAIESALWDAEAKQKGVPLWKLLGGVRKEIPCGVSIGIKPTLDELVATVERE